MKKGKRKVVKVGLIVEADLEVLEDNEEELKLLIPQKLNSIFPQIRKGFVIYDNRLKEFLRGEIK